MMVVHGTHIDKNVLDTASIEVGFELAKEALKKISNEARFQGVVFQPGVICPVW
jgi:hypothetical protein